MSDVNNISALISVVLLLLFSFVVFSKRRFKYWLSRGVPQIEPKSLIEQDNLSSAQKYLEYYKRFKAQGAKYGGVYHYFIPKFVPVDNELIKNIMIKDFDHFVDRRLNGTREAEPLSVHLFNMEGDKWKNLRVKLTPTFTSGKMKMMFHAFLECTEGLKQMIETNATNGEPVDIKDVLSRFTTDIIGSCAFGLDCNTMKNPDSDFRKQTQDVFSVSAIRRFKVLFSQLAPSFLRRYITIRGKEVENFFFSIVKDTIDYREKNNIYRKDFMHLMLQLKNRGMVCDDGKIKDENGQTNNYLSLEEFTAQCFVFFVAGFETSSTTMTFALYELSRNEDIQNKLRSEIEEVLAKYNNQITYEAVNDMKYLDQVIRETLRKHPALGIIPRLCTKDYIIPGSNVKLEKGTQLNIPVLGIHMDPEFYPDPETFDPERFTEENRKTRPTCTWIPFGEGPRICIGLRFGMLQSKVGIITILRNFKVFLNSKTRIPMVMMDPQLVTIVKDGIWFDFKKIGEKQK